MDPGWYPDPFSSGGYVRWWDGERWGPSTTAPAPTADATTSLPAPPMPPPPAEGAPTPSPRWPGQRGQGGRRQPEVAPFPLATWGQRAAALLLDWIVEGLIGVPFVLWIAGPALQRFVDSIPQGATRIPDASMNQLMQDTAALTVQLTILSVVITFLYQVPQNAIWGRTLGKRVVGLRIRPFDADGPIGWGTASLRWGTYTAGSLVLRGIFPLIDYLWPLWDRPWRQTLHDKAARTLVIPYRPASRAVSQHPPAPLPPTDLPPPNPPRPPSY